MAEACREVAMEIGGINIFRYMFTIQHVLLLVPARTTCVNHTVSYARILTTLGLSSKVHGSDEHEQQKYFARHLGLSRHVMSVNSENCTEKQYLKSFLQAEELYEDWLGCTPFYRHCSHSLHFN